ncbi:MAG: penicillin-binding protein activator [Deltaproteobacteria bacterium]|nr:penicillin-binding protein activator [Deltaproteobacteria bacterium]
MPVAPSADKDKQVPKDEQVTSDKDKTAREEQLEPSIVKILSDQASEFALQENYQDALFLYNQAFDQASVQSDGPEMSKLIADIESLLSQTPAMVIKEFIGIKNIKIPRSLLLYWLGLNYALENNTVKAIETLETFLSEYPDHSYHSETLGLVEALKESMFARDTIGCLLPLTGKYALFGQRVLTGIQMAIEELSNKYSKQFKIIIIDTKADPEIAAQGVRKLHKKNVAGIIGPLLSIDKAGIEAQKLKIPLIALTQKTDFPLLGDYLFANFITPRMQVQTLGAYLFQELGVKKVAILYPDEKYGKIYMELFWDIVDQYRGEIVGVESYDGKKTDFKEPIQKLTGEYYPVPDVLKPEPIEFENIQFLPSDILKNLKQEEEGKIEIDFEALFIPDSPSIVNMILPQLAYNDAKDIYLVGTNLWHHKSLLKDARGYNKNAVISDGFFNNSQNPAVIEFTDKFESMFDIKPKFLEAISYDTASILLTFAMDEYIDSREKLKDSLQGRRIFEGVTGNTIFDENGIAHRQLFLMTIKKGKFVEIIR